MKTPNPEQSVDTVVPIAELNLQSYFQQLRNEIAPAIRTLQRKNKIIWFCFLVHDHRSVGRPLPLETNAPFIHIRFGLPDGMGVDSFINELPSIFEHPIQKPLSEISGIDSNQLSGDWKEAWRLLGESSEWVLSFAETHSDNTDLSTDQVLQFLHFITNSLLIGGKSIFLPSGIKTF